MDEKYHIMVYLWYIYALFNQILLACIELNIYKIHYYDHMVNITEIQTDSSKDSRTDIKDCFKSSNFVKMASTHDCSI